MAPAPAPAPWDSVPAQHCTFVLVTGANSGVGLGICERLIDTFLATHSSTAHLVVLPTTRSSRKSAETVAGLRKHLARAARAARAATTASTANGPPAQPQDATMMEDRVHISSVQLDLCDLGSVRRAADQLLHSTVAFEGLGDLVIPRLDAVIFNAGMGGWTGVSWPRFIWDIITRGWVQATTRPYAKLSQPGLTVNPLPQANAKDVKGKAKADDLNGDGGAPSLGLVFCANVFGHYLFAHYVVPLLSRRRRGDANESHDSIPPGRIIWQSSVDPQWRHFSIADFQCLKTTAAYESSKMLTDILCLTADLPSVRPHSGPYLSASPPTSQTPPPAPPTTKKPNIYLAHPGIVATTLFPLHFTLMWGYVLGTLLSRWLGSPWHPVYPYHAAIAAVWLALAPQEELDALDAGKVKWGSATDFWGNTMVKQTEVDRWGWEGKVQSEAERAKEDAAVIRTLRKSVGRRLGATAVTEEDRVEFEETGARCWAEMERLRAEWERRVESAVA